MSNLFDVVEVCLQELIDGAELEAILQRYSEFADELRPILQASINARHLSGLAPSAQVVQRNRAKLLQQAALLRTEKSGRFVWFPSMQKWAMALALLVLFLFTGTSLVRAASGSLPGDSLYAVKRSWEDFTLALTFDVQEREAREVDYENERLDELHELFASGRTAQVDFAGIVTRENGDGWWISNILVIVSDQSTLPGQPIQVGAAVRVYGTTRGSSIVLAQRIELLPVGAALPEVEDTEPENEEEQPEAATQPVEDSSGSGSGEATPEIGETESPAVTAAPEIESISGTLTSIDGDIWKIDDISVDIRDATIEGTPAVGARAKAEGYFGSNGVFVALQIEIFNTGLDQDNGNSNINGDDENSGSNTNHNENGDDNPVNNNDDDGHGGGNNGSESDDGANSGSGNGD
jgi:Domain of unknown function (DUF5667)/Domain of unknown function (DUF5666)